MRSRETILNIENEGKTPDDRDTAPNPIWQSNPYGELIQRSSDPAIGREPIVPSLVCLLWQWYLQFRMTMADGFLQCVRSN